MTSTGRPVDACVGDVAADLATDVPLLAELDFQARFAAIPLADPAGGDDGATTPGGPRMVLIFLGIFGVAYWLRRRRRK